MPHVDLDAVCSIRSAAALLYLDFSRDPPRIPRDPIVRPLIEQLVTSFASIRRTKTCQMLLRDTDFAVLTKLANGDSEPAECALFMKTFAENADKLAPYLR